MPLLNHHLSVYPRWPEERTQALLEMWNRGIPAPSIARRLGVSLATVEAKLRRLRQCRRRRYVVIPKHRLKDSIPCLSCLTEFKSQGKFDRICPACERSEAWNSGVAA